MTAIFSGASIYRNRRFEKADLLIDNGIIADISPCIRPEAGVSVFNSDGLFIFPGFVDVHVHLREPGFVYKETVKTGTMSASRGGFTHVCCMPNLNPVPDSAQNIAPLLEAIKSDAVIGVHPYGAVTVGEKGNELSDMEQLTRYICAFSDDGRGIQSAALMESAMKKAKSLDRIIAAHCEVNELLHGGYIHDGEYARINGHAGICSESEWRQIERDLALAAKTGVKYHVCHISARESVELIRRAKKDGIDVTCETAPHYLIFNDGDLIDEGRFKMNPPIRSEADRLALIEGIGDGTIDMIATDHAPHSDEEKSKGLKGSLMGVVGLETSFAAMYTHFVRTGVITLEKLMYLMHDAPCKRFGISNEIEVGKPAEFTVFSLDEKHKVNPDDFLTKGRATPFSGMELYGKCLLTMYGGKAVYYTSKETVL